MPSSACSMVDSSSLVVPGALVVTSVATVAAAVQLYRYLKLSSVTDRSTTSSAGGGAVAYETSKAVDEYLQMHFALPDEVFPYKNAPKNDVNFPERCAVLVERHCDALKDFTGERPAPIALDIGCAVGGSTFHLSKVGFSAVLGMDYSKAFIKAANALKDDGMVTYRTVVEGQLTETREAHVPTDANAPQVEFRVGDACNLPSNLAPVDAVLAANLICRLPEPKKFLNALPRIVKKGGVVVLTTPFSWLEAWTKQRYWLGGYMKDGTAISSFSELQSIMTANGFELKTKEDMPFVIREHARKYQWGCAQGSVWTKL